VDSIIDQLVDYLNGRADAAARAIGSQSPIPCDLRTELLTITQVIRRIADLRDQQIDAMARSYVIQTGPAAGDRVTW
jgi:hypothetical protein